MPDPKDPIASAIETVIHASVINALGGQDGILERIVSAVLSEKVDADTGRLESYSSRAVPYIDFASKHAIRAGVKSAVDEWVKSNAETIRASVAAKLAKPENVELVAMALLHGLTASLAVSGGRIEVSIGPEPTKK